MTATGFPLPDVTAEIAQAVSRAVNEARLHRASLGRAETILTEATERATDKVEFLERLIGEMESSGLPVDIRQRLIGTAFSVLKADADLVGECQRLITQARGKD